MGDGPVSMNTAEAVDPGEAMALRLGDAASRQLRTHAAALGMPADDLVRIWVLQRLEVEEAARRGRGGGAEQLLRLVQAIDHVDLPA
ncbi:MAG TPA: hypothetical protein VFP61_06240 [Acidimicrobiales bacterium]|nr:hypothetical protein [Acidimicrobiales bacterium]